MRPEAAAKGVCAFQRSANAQQKLLPWLQNNTGVPGGITRAIAQRAGGNDHRIRHGRRECLAACSANRTEIKANYLS
jgi:hypothetical protein